MSWDDSEPEAGFLVRRILLTWLQSFVCGLSYRKTKNNCIWISKDRRQSAYIFPLVLPSRAQHRFLTNACFVLLREQKDDFHLQCIRRQKQFVSPELPLRKSDGDTQFLIYNRCEPVPEEASRGWDTRLIRRVHDHVDGYFQMRRQQSKVWKSILKIKSVAS